MSGVTRLPVVGLTLNYRDIHRTKSCVEALLENGLAHVLIWDNSADSGQSAGALRCAYGDNLAVTIVESPENLGFAAGVNRAVAWIEMAFPDLRVLLINNDARLLPGAAAMLNLAADQQPEACIVYPTIKHAGRELGTVYYHRLLALLSSSPLPGSFPYASGCCQLIVPSRLPSRPFDERFFMYGEDWEQGWRLGSRRMYHVASTLVLHEGSASSRMASPFYEQRLVLAHLLLADCLARGTGERWLMLGLRTLSLSLRALVRVLRYRSWVPGTALMAGLHEFAATRTQRP